MEDFILTIPGAKALIDRFGQWPSFHDAEVVALTLNREGESTMTVHVFRMTSQTDSHGKYICNLHTLVTFSFGEILAMDLGDFNHQNVIFGLGIAKTDDGFELTLHPCYGLTGTIRTATLAIRFIEGTPPGSVYAT